MNISTTYAIDGKKVFIFCTWFLFLRKCILA